MKASRQRFQASGRQRHQYLTLNVLSRVFTSKTSLKNALLIEQNKTTCLGNSDEKIFPCLLILPILKKE